MEKREEKFTAKEFPCKNCTEHGPGCHVPKCPHGWWEWHLWQQERAKEIRKKEWLESRLSIVGKKKNATAKAVGSGQGYGEKRRVKEMTQKQMIQEHLLQFGEITPETARTEYACARLSARIAELREDGMCIETKEKKITNRFGKKVKYAEKYVVCRMCEEAQQ